MPRRTDILKPIQNNNHMKRANFIGFIAVLIALSCSINTWAGEKYYKNFSIKIYNPDTAKGRVYVLPYNETDTAFCTVSEDPAVAGIDGYLSNVDDKFKVNILAIPEDGYVLSYISSLEAYKKRHLPNQLHLRK